jgi:hypothetical protein
LQILPSLSKAGFSKRIGRGSWMNLVERWFAALTEKQLRRGVHRSTRELEAASVATSTLRTNARSRSGGPRRPMRSWRASNVFVIESLIQDTSFTSMSTVARILKTLRTPWSRPHF